MADGRRQLGRRAAHYSAWAAVLILAAIAAVCLAGGLGGVWQHLHAELPRPYRLSSAIVLLLAAGAQARLAYDVWRRSRHSQVDKNVLAVDKHTRLRDVALWAMAGAVGAFLLAPWLGPDPNVRYLFRALLAIDMTAAAWVALSPGCIFAHWLPRQGWPRGMLNAMATLLLVIAAAEGLLRAYTAAIDPDAPLAWYARGTAMTSRPRQSGPQANGNGYSEVKFAAPQHNKSRVAVLAGDAGLFGGTRQGWLELVERRATSLDVCNCSRPGCCELHHAALLAKDVAPLQPRTVVLVIETASLGLTGPRTPGRFDWQSLQLYQRLTRAAPQRPVPSCSTVMDWPLMLLACQSPIPPQVQDRYDEIETALARLSETCHRQQIEFKLVLAPTAYQVDTALCRRLCQRHGVDLATMDLELPQRRLAELAAQVGAPTLDLLPTLRAATGPVYERESNQWNAKGHELAGHVVADWLDAPTDGQLARRAAR